MAPGWFGPPNAHAMRQQQAAQQGGGAYYHSQAAGSQRQPPQEGGAGGMDTAGAPSPHQNYHQRNSPPMRGTYHPGAMGQHIHPPPPPHGPVGHPHGPRMAQGGGRFAVQHPSQGMVVGGPRPMPPNAHPGPHVARHHAPSPGMPRRMQMPASSMRPMSHSQQTPRSAFDQQQRAAMQQQHGAQQAHMMRLQQDHQQQMQQRHLQNGSNGEGESKVQQNGHFQPPPQTPDQRGAYQRESPSPPPVPPHAQTQQSDAGPPKPSPASLPDNEGNSMGVYDHPQAHTPSPWSAGPGMGPLRESRLQNMPQNHLYSMQQQQQHHAQPQRPHPHPHPGASMNHRAFINENMQRFQSVQHQQVKQPMGPNAAKLAQQHQQQMARANAMMSPAQQQQQAQARAQQEQQQKSNQQQPGKKPGPDVTMDAASMLLALRTSASPATVSQATLEEQQSKDQADDSSKTVPMTVSQSQDKEDHDDEVPELQSSSSSLSIQKSCNTAQDEEEQQHVVPKNFPTRLALPNDEAKLNSLHCFLRSELLEIFVVERSQNKSPTHSPGSSVGRVGLRCVFCAMQRKRNQVSTTDDSVSTPLQNRCDEAPMAVFYPKSIAEIYRLVTSWQRCHLRKCRNLPPDVRSKWQLLRENDKSRGKTHYWITSAKEIGLMDCQSRAGGIRFASPCKSTGSAATDNDDSGDEKAGEDSKSNAYQPYNIPNFKEGPSQKQREASSMAVNATPASSTVESPLKEDATVLKTPTTVSSGEGPSASGVNSGQVTMVGV